MEIEEREEYQNYKAFYDQKKKSLLEGDDVIHLTYLSPLIDKNDIDLLQKDFSELELRLSSWDDSGVIKNSLQDYSLEIYFLIANPITLEILKSVGQNVIWETLKYSAVKFHKKIFNNTVEKRAREISFGFKIKIDNQTTCSFKLDGDLDDNLILESMDKALKHTKELKNQEIPPSERPIFSTYDTNSHNWKRINITEELKKKRLKK